MMARRRRSLPPTRDTRFTSMVSRSPSQSRMSSSSLRTSPPRKTARQHRGLHQQVEREAAAHCVCGRSASGWHHRTVRQVREIISVSGNGSKIADGYPALGATKGDAKICTCSTSTETTRGGTGGSQSGGGGPGLPNHMAPAPNNGAPGNGTSDCGDGGSGRKGADAPLAANASAPTSLGTLGPNGWIGTSGLDAVEGGKPGQGGGGGGSFNDNNGGGGGGCGGCGGSPGKAGGSGGASIALLVNESTVTVALSKLSAKGGGKGGGGGGGGPGLTGGPQAVEAAAGPRANAEPMGAQAPAALEDCPSESCSKVRRRRKTRTRRSPSRLQARRAPAGSRT